jgi:hypothetical protein
MNSKINFRFLGISLLYLMIAIISKLLYQYFKFDKIYIDFISGLLVPPMIFYFLIAFDSKKHNRRQLLFFILGFFLFQILITDNYNETLFVKLFGIVLSGLLCSITLSQKVNKWLLKENVIK